MTTEISIRDIQNVVYTISYHDMVQQIVETYHPNDTVLILYDPGTHLEYIRKFGFKVPEEEMYESKVIVIIVPDLDDALSIIKNMSYITGPYTQVWALGRYITDNIEK